MNLNFNKGSATIELLIAMAIGVIFLSSATLVFFGAQTSGLDNGLDRRGAVYGKLATDDAVAAVSASWNNTSGSAGVEEGFFATSSSIVPQSDCMTMIHGDANWTSEKERHLGSETVTMVGNWAAAKAVGGDCPSEPAGDWDTPRVYGYTPPNIIDGQATDVATAKIGLGRYAFITSENSNQNANDLWIIDATDGQHPSLIPSSPINTDDSLNAIDVARNNATGKLYAYVVGYNEDQSGSCGPGAHHKPYKDQFQVIDVTNPSFPILKASVALLNVIDCGDQPAGVSVYFYEDKVYVGTKKTEGNELTIFDVSDPTNPIEKASIPVDRDVNSIIVRDGFAFIATSADAGTHNPLKVFDVNPVHVAPNPIQTYLKEVGSFTAEDDRGGTSIALLGNRLYLGLQVAPSAGKKDFYILDVTDPKQPIQFGTSSGYNVGLNGAGSSISGIDSVSHYAFLGTTDPNDPLIVMSVVDPTAAFRINTCSAPPLPQSVSGVKYLDNLLFMSFRSNAAFRIMYDTPAICS